jgi:hypothetical protein
LEYNRKLTPNLLPLLCKVKKSRLLSPQLLAILKLSQTLHTEYLLLNLEATACGEEEVMIPMESGTIEIRTDLDLNMIRTESET